MRRGLRRAVLGFALIGTFVAIGLVWYGHVETGRIAPRTSESRHRPRRTTLRPGEPATAPRTRKWNIVLFLSDALRAPNVHTYGYRRATTPVLDRLAKQGVLFRRHFSAASFTRPSVSQLFTGMFLAPALMGREYADDIEREFPQDVLVLPRLLREHGYYTILVSAHPWFGASAPVLAWFDEHAVVTGPQTAYAPFEALMPAVRKALDDAAARRQPFFLYLHSLDTHHPYKRHQGFDDHFGDRKVDRRYDRYDSGIRYTDHWVGQVLRELAGRGLADDTMVAFTSDHGEEFNELGEGWANRTHGAQVRRGATHVPLILRLPLTHRVTGTFRDVTWHPDLAPTLAALAIPGLDLSRYRLDGTDLSQRILGLRFEPTRRRVFTSNGRFFAMRRGDQPRVDVIFDAWSDQASLYAYHVNRSNYPEPKQIEGRARQRSMIAELKEIARDPSQHFQSAPAKPPVPLSGHVSIGRVAPTSTDRIPSYEDGIDDRWALHPGRVLSCEPAEDCGRITIPVAEKVVPGRYRVRIELHDESRKAGFANGFSVIVRGDKPRRIVFPPHKGDAARAESVPLDAGVLELAGDLEFTIERPRGGVAITGFVFEPEDSVAQAPPPVDPALTDQLRALGYVE